MITATIMKFLYYNFYITFAIILVYKCAPEIIFCKMVLRYLQQQINVYFIYHL